MTLLNRSYEKKKHQKLLVDEQEAARRERNSMQEVLWEWQAAGQTAASI